MILNLFKIFCSLLCFNLIISFPYELKSFSEIQLPKGISRYLYSYSKNIQDYLKTPYIFIKLTDYKKIDLRIYFNEDETFFSLTQKDDWINIPITKEINLINISLIINSKEKNLKMLFIDSSKIMNLSLIKFLSLNFQVSKLSRKPLPLQFNITVDNNILLSIEEDSNDNNKVIIDDKYLLSYCSIEEEKECKFIEVNNAKLIKDKIYRFKLNCYADNNNKYCFKNFKILYYMEEIYFKNNTFIINNFTQNNYLFLNLQNYQEQTINFYINDNSGIFHKNFKYITITENNFNKNNTNIRSIKFLDITNGQISSIEKNFSDYLIININNKNRHKIIEGYILIFSKIYEINEVNKSIKIFKGMHTLIFVNKSYSSSGIAISSYKNMKLLKSKNEYTNKIKLNYEKNEIYIDSSKENTNFICQIFSTESKFYNYKFLDDNDLEKFLNGYKYDNYFIRKTSNNDKPGFYSYYCFDIEEKYYIFTKKYLGGINLYKYKKSLDINTNINEFMEQISYYDEKSYEIINNKLIILSGTQFFNYYFKYGSYFDILFQKVKDLDYIDIITEEKKYCRNTVKLLNKEKIYTIKFELNHLVKLENNFLDSEVIFTSENQTKYILNNKNKILNLKGNNFTVKSNKISIIYFYEKIENYNDYSIIEFDKFKFGKNMKINITNKNDYDIKIAIANDFGFKYHYPMINFNDLEIVTISAKKTNYFYIENYYDSLEVNLSESEGEKYYIYIFQITKDNKLILLNESNIELSLPLYYDSITKSSKHNFNLISKSNSSLLLKIFNKFDINYHFIKCSNDDIKFDLKTIDSNGNIINNSKQINDIKYFRMNFSQGQTLVHNFQSKNEFLFLYDYSYDSYYDQYLIPSIKKHGIRYLNLDNRNIFTIEFTPAFTGYNDFVEYYIIIARKNEDNNLYTFSNPCYLANLIISESNQICYEKFYYPDYNSIYANINIDKIKRDENDEYIITIISHNFNLYNHLEIYSPVIYNKIVKNKEAIKLTFFEKINFRPEKDFFIYEHLFDEKLILYIFFNSEMYLKVRYYNEDKKVFIPGKYFVHEIILDKKGKYYFDFFNLEQSDDTKNNTIYVWTFNKMIKEIDLSKDIYSEIFINYFQKYYSRNGYQQYENKDLPYYKISNLKEDKKVYFTYSNLDNPIYNVDSPFLICKNKNEECVTNIYSYTFTKGNEYTLYFNIIKDPNIDIIDIDVNYFSKYTFFPISQNTIINIKEGHYIINSPKILYLDKSYNFYFTNLIPNFVSSEGINKGKNLPEIKYYRLYYYFDIEKNSKVDNIILIPGKNNELSQLFITNTRFRDSENITVLQEQNGLILIDNLYSDEYYLKSFESYFETFTSPIENINFISFDNKANNKYKKYIYNHFGKKLLYIDKNNNNNDVIIKKNIYEPKYLYFSILNDETVKYFYSLTKAKNIYINERINTDRIKINDLINIYIDKFDKKYNLYIKKIYGPIKLYESEYKLNDINNFDILTKPINNLKNKRSIFNRLIQINKEQLITGYISGNSLLDIYLEEDNDNEDIYLNDFNNRKYLKKGIEYKLHFYLNHLIKLEPQFNAEITIYNNDIKIILNNKNQTAVLIGNDFKIKSNNNVMVYFYPKTQKFQKRIFPNKGEIIEIKRKGCVSFRYIIDFGFEGFEPLNKFDYFENQIYIENIYDNLEVQLAKEEYLYIYYDVLDEDLFEINYISNNIISSAYKFNFNLIKKNMTEKKFIIPKINIKKTKFRIHHCAPPYKIKLHYEEFRNSKDEYEGKIIEKNYNLLYSSSVFKFTYESENDFILSYSYNDSKDDYIINNKKWINDRIKFNNLTINKIKLIKDDMININFNANYKNSLTKYIIMITEEEKNINLEKLKNICFLTELINQKEGKFITEEIYDIGENNFIEVFIDISKLKCLNKKCYANIISEELRFEKNLMFYEPKEFYYEKYSNISNIAIECGFILFIIFVIIYFKKTKNKKNSIKNRIIMNKEELGLELNDYNELINNKNQ